MHSLAPEPLENVPSLQSKQKLEASQYVYLPTLQAVQVVDPAALRVPAWHTKHTLAPLVWLYLPATQATHTPTATPPEAVPYFPEGQAWQVLGRDAPVPLK